MDSLLMQTNGQGDQQGMYLKTLKAFKRDTHPNQDNLSDVRDDDADGRWRWVRTVWEYSSCRTWHVYKFVLQRESVKREKTGSCGRHKYYSSQEKRAAAAAFPATEQDTRRSRTLNPLPQCFSLHQANSMINTTAVFNTSKSREGASWPKQWSAKRGSGKRSGKFSLLFPKSFAVFLSSSLLVCLLSRLEVLLL